MPGDAVPCALIGSTARGLKRTELVFPLAHLSARSRFSRSPNTCVKMGSGAKPIDLNSLEEGGAGKVGNAGLGGEGAGGGQRCSLDSRHISMVDIKGAAQNREKKWLKEKSGWEENGKLELQQHTDPKYISERWDRRQGLVFLVSSDIRRGCNSACPVPCLPRLALQGEPVRWDLRQTGSAGAHTNPKA